MRISVSVTRHARRSQPKRPGKCLGGTRKGGYLGFSGSMYRFGSQVLSM